MMTRLEAWPTPDGEWRYLGNRPSTHRLMTAGALPDIPVSEWREYDLTTDAAYPIKIKDQNGRGACNGHAAASSLEIARWISGQHYEALSAWYIYAKLCNGWDAGSSIADALALLSREGTCEEPLVLYGLINPTMISAAAKANAANHKIEIGFALPDWKSLCIAAQLRQPFNFSLSVNGNFNTLDSFGRPQNHAGAHNHAVCGGMGMKRTATGEWLIKMQNSWGTRWGQNGYCWIGEKNVQGWGWDAYSVVATTVDPTDKPPALA